MTKIAAIASGSNGNCYYIENKGEAVLIDAGVSRKQIIERMQNLNLDIEKVKGIFISHEHTDHTRGAEVLSKLYKIPVYFTKKTYDASRVTIKEELLNFFEINTPVSFDELLILPFPKKHDAVDPCSFIVKAGNKNIGVVTDVGSQCENIISHIPQCDALFLETNYDDEMLKDSSYPYFLKKRIDSEFGHLSNKDACNIILDHSSERLTHLFLSHLSANSNCPRLAHQHINSQLELRGGPKINVIMTSREKESDLFNLD